jgi:aquaporin Z
LDKTMSAERRPPARAPGGLTRRDLFEALAVAEWPARRDFEDPRLEGRRLFSETFGTFLLVLTAAGGGVVEAVSHGAVGRVAAVTAPGLMVVAIILFMGAVSGAHLNPAVTISFAVRGDFPWRRVPGYVLAQLAGAALACLVLRALFGKVGMLGATEPGAGVTDLQTFGTELLLTTGLLSTILGTASRAQNVGPLSALAVGGYIILAGLWSSPVSGASMNPARSFGPDLVLGDFHHYWPYVAGPLAGGLIAVGFAHLLRGRGGDRSALLAAQGSLPAGDEPPERAEVQPGDAAQPSVEGDPSETTSAGECP